MLDNPVEQLAVYTKSAEVVPSENFGSVKQKILNLHKTLDSQFQNAEKEFLSENFLKLIKKDLGKKEEKLEEISEKKEAEHDWTCDKCTYWNANNKTQKCNCC